MRNTIALVFGAAILAGNAASAACPTAEAIATYTENFLGRKPAKSFGTAMSLEDGLCAQRLLVAKLEPALGGPVGYKVGLSNKAAQDAFKIPHPVRGILLEKMLLPDGASIPAAGPIVFEADMLLRVRDEGVNEAKQPLDILRHLDAVIPFIEIPTGRRHLAEGEPLDGPNLIAMNVTAWRGIAGKPIPIEPTQAFADALSGVQVTLADDTGKEYGRGTGAALLGHPLNVIAWLVEDLKKSGEKLKAGDVVSLGTFSPLTPPTAGRTVTARYEGLPGGTATVSVRFE